MEVIQERFSEDFDKNDGAADLQGGIDIMGSNQRRAQRINSSDCAPRYRFGNRTQMGFGIYHVKPHEFRLSIIRIYAKLLS